MIRLDPHGSFERDDMATLRILGRRMEPGAGVDGFESVVKGSWWGAWLGLALAHAFCRRLGEQPPS